MTLDLAGAQSDLADESQPPRPGFVVWLTGLSGAGKSTIAGALAAELEARFVPYEALGTELADADVVIAATEAPEPVLTAGGVASALARREGAPMLIIDIGVCFRPSVRIASAIPGTSYSITASVAWGVTSRGPRPVPPVVTISCTDPPSAQRRRCSEIRSRSSGMTS